MKKIMMILWTVAFLLAVNTGIAWLTNSAFIDFSFFLGLLVAFAIRFFNSAGGHTTKAIDLQVQSSTGIKQESETKKFLPSTGFYTCLAYSAVSLVVTFFYYMDYFV
ncbi:hypothetical protein [Halobacillus salinus]|uniref:hypothetical protein n=1 Tax=Halobacillus salinus TaxID=192814 RepID=UPI0009A674D6|nr:hypothetical protein [Halobacillus salinus]